MMKNIFKKVDKLDPGRNPDTGIWRTPKKREPYIRKPLITQKNPVKSKPSTTEGSSPSQVMDAVAKAIGLVSLAAIAVVFGLISLGFLDLDSVGSALDKVGSDVGNLVPNIIKKDVFDSQNIGSTKCAMTSEDCCKWTNHGDGIPPTRTVAISVLEPCGCPENTYDESGRTSFIPDDEGNMVATRLCTCKDCPGN